MSKFTYFIVTDNYKFVKIGYTLKDPKYRLRELQTGNHMKLLLYGYVRGNCENECHENLYIYKSNGEWFHFTPEVEEYIENIFGFIRERSSKKYYKLKENPKTEMLLNHIYNNVYEFEEHLISSEFASRRKIDYSEYKIFIIKRESSLFDLIHTFLQTSGVKTEDIINFINMNKTVIRLGGKQSSLIRVITY